jgi:hypothetical protein
MEGERLIRVGRFSGDTKGVADIVALADPVAAVELVTCTIADPKEHVEDLGRVGEALLAGDGPEAWRLCPYVVSAITFSLGHYVA